MAFRTVLAFALALPLALPSSATAQDTADTPDSASDGEGGADEAQAPGEAAEAGPAEGSAGKADGDALDIDALRREYLSLRDRLFRSRARAAAVASALYSTRLTIALGHGSTRFYSITRATVRLDGANVFDDTDGELGERLPRFEGFVAPGRHTVTVRIEAVAKDDDRFATTLDNTFSIVAQGGKDLQVDATVSDDGDIASSWKDDSKGSYNLHLDVKVRALAREDRDDSAGTDTAENARRPRNDSKGKRRAVARQ